MLVDLRTGGLERVGNYDTGHFSVKTIGGRRGAGTDGGPGAPVAALGLLEAGRDEPGGVALIPQPAVIQLAGKASSKEGKDGSPAWLSSFQTMIQLASENGWIARDGAIRAQIDPQG
ncbi:MAG: hypothetical protein ACYCVN_10620 [Acidimicrobiales bacterium]